MKDELNKEWLIFLRHKRFRPSTISTYTSSVEWYLSKCGDNIKEMSYHEIRTILLQIKNKNTVNSTITAIRQFYLHVFGIELDWRQLPYVKKCIKVQSVYSKDDILKVLNSITNEKQKAILALIIDCGLRISEPCEILLADCNEKEQSIVLRSAKGDSDRIVYPSESVWKFINDYLEKWQKKPSDKYLFDGMAYGMPYTTTSIREFVKHHCKKCGVRYLGVHAIRRFTITWSIENKVPISVMAIKAGHRSSRTIEKSYLIHSPSYLRGVITPLM